MSAWIPATLTVSYQCHVGDHGRQRRILRAEQYAEMLQYARQARFQLGSCDLSGDRERREDQTKTQERAVDAGSLYRPNFSGKSATRTNAAAWLFPVIGVTG
jgi:hypothetical protein